MRRLEFCDVKMSKRLAELSYGEWDCVSGSRTGLSYGDWDCVSMSGLGYLWGLGLCTRVKDWVNLSNWDCVSGSKEDCKEV